MKRKTYVARVTSISWRERSGKFETGSFIFYYSIIIKDPWIHFQSYLSFKDNTKAFCLPNEIIVFLKPFNPRRFKKGFLSRERILNKFLSTLSHISLASDSICKKNTFVEWHRKL